MEILIVEDDRRLALQLKKGLEEHKQTISLAANGPEGETAVLMGHFDVLVFDIMLPGFDGLTLVRRLRAAGCTTPILLLTARDSADDIVAGLDAGADDYLTKPFSLKVLLARLRALSRRREVEPRTWLQIGDLMLDPATHSVKRGGVEITLTPTEFLLLETLMRHAGRVMKRDRLLETVWGNIREVENNTLDVYIRLLRSKTEPPGTPRLLYTVRGIGYVMREPEMQ